MTAVSPGVTTTAQPPSVDSVHVLKPAFARSSTARRQHTERLQHEVDKEAPHVIQPALLRSPGYLQGAEEPIPSRFSAVQHAGRRVQDAGRREQHRLDSKSQQPSLERSGHVPMEDSWITSLLKKSASLREVAKILELHSSSLNVIHLTAALTKVSQLGTRAFRPLQPQPHASPELQPLPLSQPHTQPPGQAVHPSQHPVQPEHGSHVQSRALSVGRASADRGVADRALQQAQHIARPLLAQVRAQLEDFDSWGISSVLHALAKLRMREPLIYDLLDTVEPQLADMNVQSFNIIIYSLGLLGVTASPQWMQLFYKHSRPLLPRFGDHALSMTLWGLANMRSLPRRTVEQREWEDGLYSALSHCLARQQCSPQSLPRLAWALASLDLFPPRALALALAQEGLRQLPEFDGEATASFLWGVAKLKCQMSDKWQHTFCQITFTRLPTYSAKTLSTLMYSFALLGRAPPSTPSAQPPQLPAPTSLPANAAAKPSPPSLPGSAVMAAAAAAAAATAADGVGHTVPDLRLGQLPKPGHPRQPGTWGGLLPDFTRAGPTYTLQPISPHVGMPRSTGANGSPCSSPCSSPSNISGWHPSHSSSPSNGAEHRAAAVPPTPPLLPHSLLHGVRPSSPTAVPLKQQQQQQQVGAAGPLPAPPPSEVLPLASNSSQQLGQGQQVLWPAMPHPAPAPGNQQPPQPPGPPPPSASMLAGSGHQQTRPTLMALHDMAPQHSHRLPSPPPPMPLHPSLGSAPHSLPRHSLTPPQQQQQQQQQEAPALGPPPKPWQTLPPPQGGPLISPLRPPGPAPLLPPPLQPPALPPEVTYWGSALQHHLLRRLPSSGPRITCNLLYSFAKLRLLPEPPLLQALTTCTLQQLPSMTPQGLSNTVWALAKLQSPPGPRWLGAFLEEAWLKMGVMNAQELGMMVWALVQLQAQPDPAWFTRFDSLSVRQLEGALVQNLSFMIHAFAHFRHLPSPEWQRAFFYQLEVQASRVQPVQAADIFWALAELDLAVPESLFKWLSDAITEDPAAITLPQLCATVAAMARLGLPMEPGFLARVGAEVHLNMAELELRSLAELAWGFSCTEFKPSISWLEQLDAQVAQRLQLNAGSSSRSGQVGARSTGGSSRMAPAMQPQPIASRTRGKVLPPDEVVAICRWAGCRPMLGPSPPLPLRQALTHFLHMPRVLKLVSADQLMLAIQGAIQWGDGAALMQAVSAFASHNKQRRSRVVPRT